MLKKKIQFKSKQLWQKTLETVGLEVRRIGSGFMMPKDVRWLRQFHYLSNMYDRVRDCDGDIVECGVGMGRTFLMFAYLLSADKEHAQRKLWGFDSFEGFPDPSVHDDSTRGAKKGDWSGATPAVFSGWMQGLGIKKEFLTTRTHIVPGFFNESLKKFPSRPIALLHIDADLYESYKDVLDVLFPNVVPGGVVLFDEYKDTKWPGATKAVDEYFSGKRYAISYDEIGKKYFVVK